MVLLAQLDLGPGGQPARKKPWARKWGSLGFCWKTFSREASLFAFLQAFGLYFGLFWGFFPTGKLIITEWTFWLKRAGPEWPQTWVCSTKSHGLCSLSMPITQHYKIIQRDALYGACASEHRFSLWRVNPVLNPLWRVPDTSQAVSRQQQTAASVHSGEQRAKSKS